MEELSRCPLVPFEGSGREVAQSAVEQEGVEGIGYRAGNGHFDLQKKPRGMPAPELFRILPDRLVVEGVPIPDSQECRGSPPRGVSWQIGCSWCRRPESNRHEGLSLAGF